MCYLKQQTIRPIYINFADEILIRVVGLEEVGVLHETA